MALTYIRQLVQRQHNSTWFSAVPNFVSDEDDRRPLLLCLSTYITPDGYINVAAILFSPNYRFLIYSMQCRTTIYL